MKKLKMKAWDYVFILITVLMMVGVVLLNSVTFGFGLV